MDITPDQRCNLSCSHNTQDFYSSNTLDFINITSLSLSQRARRKRRLDDRSQSQASAVCEGIKRQQPDDVERCSDAADLDRLSTAVETHPQSQF